MGIYEGYWTREPHGTDLGLSRYIDLGGDGIGTVPDSPHHRAIAESGWDNTTRFGDDATRVIPVDLNAQLHRYEADLAGIGMDLGYRWLTLDDLEHLELSGASCDSAAPCSRASRCLGNISASIILPVAR